MDTTEERIKALERAYGRLTHRFRKVRYRLSLIDKRNEELAEIVVRIGKRVVELGGPTEDIVLTDNKKGVGRVS